MLNLTVFFRCFCTTSVLMALFYHPAPCAVSCIACHSRLFLTLWIGSRHESCSLGWVHVLNSSMQLYSIFSPILRMHRMNWGIHTTGCILSLFVSEMLHHQKLLLSTKGMLHSPAQVLQTLELCSGDSTISLQFSWLSQNLWSYRLHYVYLHTQSQGEISV